MAISKNKTSLQMAVDKRVVKTWKEVVKATGMQQGDLFAVILAEFLKHSLAEANKSVKKHGKEKA